MSSMMSMIPTAFSVFMYLYANEVDPTFAKSICLGVSYVRIGICSLFDKFFASCKLIIFMFAPESSAARITGLNCGGAYFPCAESFWLVYALFDSGSVTGVLCDPSKLHDLEL